MDHEQLETAYLEIYNDTASNADAAAGSVPLSAVKGKLAGASDEWSDNGERHVIKVQFHPSTLTFSTHDNSAAKKKKVSLTQKKQDRVETAFADHTDASISVSFQLVFDRTIYEDSDVQPDVERLLALVKDPFVRKAAFWWGEMSYTGVIKNVDAEYVLFNALGIPARALVSLTLEGI